MIVYLILINFYDKNSLHIILGVLSFIFLFVDIYITVDFNNIFISSNLRFHENIKEHEKLCNESYNIIYATNATIILLVIVCLIIGLIYALKSKSKSFKIN